MEKLNLSPKIEENNTAELERTFFGTTKDGAEVYDKIKDGHFHSEGGLTSDLLGVALSKIDTEGKKFLKEVVDFDHVVGGKTCVEVGPEDDILMAYRKTEDGGTRSGMTPMVKNRQMIPCNSVTLILKSIPLVKGKEAYELQTAYIGEGSPREPWDPNLTSEEERKECEDFWKSHALIYDDGLIDWEKTKAFEFMSEPAKEAEGVRQRTVYAGLFIDPEDLYSKKPATLEKVIEHPHITTAFKPEASQLYLDQLGDKARIIAIGYGNDGDNEGLLVKVETEDPEIQEACDTAETLYITLSTSKNGQAKNTASLNFTPLDEPFELTGKYGIFSQGKVIQSQAELANLQDEISICRHNFDKNQQ